MRLFLLPSVCLCFLFFEFVYRPHTATYYNIEKNYIKHAKILENINKGLQLVLHFYYVLSLSVQRDKE